jgi:DNA-binding IclR family transcriptional regulator
MAVSSTPAPGTGPNTSTGAAAAGGRRSPPATRVLAVLRVLTDTSPTAQSLRDVSRRAGLTASTCLGILNELCHESWVVRHEPGPRYTLGPAAMVTGRAAGTSHPTLGAARDTLFGVADSLGMVCTVSAVISEHLVVLERIGVAHGESPVAAPGTRFPFAAPIGVMFAAWSGDQAATEWFARSLVSLDDDRLDRAHEVIRTCRTQGWIADRLTDAELVLHQLLQALDVGSDDERVSRALLLASSIFGYRDYLPEEIAIGEGPDGEVRSVSVICAPTFAPDGRLELVLGAYVMQPRVPVSEVRRIGALVAEAAASVTRSAGGHDPFHP